MNEGTGVMSGQRVVFNPAMYEGVHLSDDMRMESITVVFYLVITLLLCILVGCVGFAAFTLSRRSEQIMIANERVNELEKQVKEAMEADFKVDPHLPTEPLETMGTDRKLLSKKVTAEFNIDEEIKEDFSSPMPMLRSSVLT